MSKVQDFINEAKKRANVSGNPSRNRSLSKPAIGAPLASVRIDGFPSLSLDADAMERSCLMPYVKDNRATNAYMLLRTRLLQQMRPNQWKLLMVTGTLPNDGKTTTAINLAIGISQDVRQTVLLVDLDLERPAIAKSLGVETTAGLSDYLRGDADANDVLYNTDMDRLCILPNFESIHSSEMLVSPKMLALLDHIKGLDPNMIVIFDMPPVLSSDSVLAFGPQVDALLMVISEGRTNRSLLQRANQMIEGIPSVGVVLNRSSEGNAGGYY